MTTLGNGLSAAEHDEDALSVKEAELDMRRRLGESEADMLAVQNNLASTYQLLGRSEEALHMKRDVYFGYLKLKAEEHKCTLSAALNYASSLKGLSRFEEAKSVLRKTMPVARRVLGEGNELTLRMRKVYARALCEDGSAPLDDLREAVTTFEDAGRIARRVFGGEHPLTVGIEYHLRNTRALESGDVSSLREAVDAMNATSN